MRQSAAEEAGDRAGLLVERSRSFVGLCKESVNTAGSHSSSLCCYRQL